MNTIAEHIRAGYPIVSSHGSGLDHHFLVLQSEDSVVIAKLPKNTWSGKLKDNAGERVEIIEVSQ